MVAVVVGASVAGVRTAQALRRLGYPDGIVVVGDEHEIPYDKPPLSKSVLAATIEPDRIRLITPEAAERIGVTLRLGCQAVHLDVTSRYVELRSGERIGYDHVVLATGSSARVHPWPASDRINVLRTLDDSRRISGQLAAGTRVVVVGGGFIGAEVAATARRLGSCVTVVDPLPVPAGRLLGDQVGRLIAAMHERNGVQTRFGVGVAAIADARGPLRVELTDGTALAADTVVVGIGAVPNDGWLASSDLRVEHGVVCDRYCRAVGAGDVYAAGDLARWWHSRHSEYVRVEHWTNAAEQADRVAYNIVHADDPVEYAPVEYIWSDQNDWKIQIGGRPEVAVEHVLIGTAARFAALYAAADGSLVGAAAVNWPRAMLETRAIIERAGPLGEAHDRLAPRAQAAAGALTAEVN